MLSSIAKLALVCALLCAASSGSLAGPSKVREEPSKTSRVEHVQQQQQELERVEQEPQQREEQVQLHEAQEPERQQYEEQQQIVEGAQPRAEAEPYAFSYNVDGSARSESGDSRGVVRGFYRLAGPDGSSRQVDYIADHQGFRATINTNELGTEPQSPAHVAMRSSQPLSAAVVPLAAPVVPIVAESVVPVVRASADLSGVKGARELLPPALPAAPLPAAPLAATKGRELPPPPPPAPTKGRAVLEEAPRKAPQPLPIVRPETKSYQRLSPTRTAFATAIRHAHYPVAPVAPRAYHYNRPIYASAAQLPRRGPAGVASFYSPPGLDGDEQPLGFDVE